MMTTDTQTVTLPHLHQLGDGLRSELVIAPTCAAGTYGWDE